MRRLHGGLLAAALLFVVTGCGSEGTSLDAAPDHAPVPIRTPTLAVSSQVTSEAKPDGSTLTVVVTSPDGVSSPGLDAAVSVLIERPELDVVVVAPAGGTADAGGGEAHTMSGFPAHIVDASTPDPLARAIEELGVPVDLVVVGLVEGAVLGSGLRTSAVAHHVHAFAGLGHPVLAVTVGTEHGADLAAAGLMLRSLLDLDLEALLAPGARFLAVPSCDGGLVRGPIAAEAAPTEAVVAGVDCQDLTAGHPEDDVDAHMRGFATLVERVDGHAIP